MVISSHIGSLKILNQLHKHNKSIATAFERLASGKRINRAADDPAGLAISEKMKGQIRGLAQAGRNVQDGISLIQTAEGGLTEVHAMMQRIRELTVQAGNDTLSGSDRDVIQKEINQLVEGIGSVFGSTQFNTRPILQSEPLRIQTGPNAGQSMELIMPNLNVGDLKFDRLNVRSYEDANNALTVIDEGIKKISGERSRLGSYQNRLEHTLNYLSNYEVNLVAAESRISDADIAREIMELTRGQLLLQVSLAMLAQANQQQSLILRLLK